MAARQAAVESNPQCGYRLCKDGRRGTPMLRCANHPCPKLLHPQCHIFVLEKLQVAPIDDPAFVVCTKKCYQKAVKGRAAANDKSMRWHDDGPLGPQDTNTSLNFLIEWLITEGNYNRFRGGARSGENKGQVAESIARMMTARGFKSQRAKDSVLSKIVQIEKEFKTAHDWANRTGSGVKKAGDQAGFDAAVRSKCPYYDELLPVFGDRSSARPVATTDELDRGNILEELSATEDEDDDPLSDDDEHDGGGKPRAVASKQRTSSPHPLDPLSDEDDDGGGKPRAFAAKKRTSSARPLDLRSDSSESENGEARGRQQARRPSLGKGTKSKTRPLTAVKKTKTRSSAEGMYGSSQFLEMAEKKQASRDAQLDETRRHNQAMEGLQRQENAVAVAMQSADITIARMKKFKDVMRDLGDQFTIGQMRSLLPEFSDMFDMQQEFTDHRLLIW